MNLTSFQALYIIHEEWQTHRSYSMIETGLTRVIQGNSDNACIKDGWTITELFGNLTFKKRSQPRLTASWSLRLCALTTMKCQLFQGATLDHADCSSTCAHVCVCDQVSDGPYGSVYIRRSSDRDAWNFHETALDLKEHAVLRDAVRASVGLQTRSRPWVVRVKQPVFIVHLCSETLEHGGCRPYIRHEAQLTHYEWRA